MPASLKLQREACEAARRVLLGSPVPRKSEREELAAHLDEAADTLKRLEITRRDLKTGQDRTACADHTPDVSEKIEGV